jgi:diacylglycerol O-acyltransferase
MAKPVASSSLSAADSAFLFLERKEVPLHIASVCVFDGPIPFEKFVASIDSRLHLVPRYLQIPVFSPWNLGFPSWEGDSHFDVRRHVFHVTLDRPGGEAELEALAGRILSQLLDRSKPLWDVHVVDGLEGGRGAIIWRVHHALADGLSGVELMKIMLDPTPDVPETIPKPRYRRARRRAAQPAPTADIPTAINKTLGSLLELEAGLLELTQSLIKDSQQSPLKGLAELLPEFTASIERLPFNKPCTGARKFCWTEWSLAEVKAVREALGGTVNDVILTVVTRALARYVKLHGQSVVNRFVRIVCPVSLRLPEQQARLGNQISFLPVALPMDARGPVQMLKAVSARTEALKRSGALGVVTLAAKWLAAAPPPIQALFWRSIPEIILPVPLLNMICTNVMGSPTALYAVGRRMLAAYPQVPTGWDLGVGCAVHSYDGKLFFGLLADTDAAPDVDRLRDFLVLSFEELRRSAALRKARGAPGTTWVARSRQKDETDLARGAASQTMDAEPSPAAPVAGHSKEAA